MKTIFLNQQTIELPECVATIGVFDGVHLGHQRLIGMVATKAREQKRSSMVITFDRQPQQLFVPDYHPQLLTTLEEKESVISQMDIDFLVVLPFTKELAMLTAEAFMREILWEQLHVKMLITGYDNRFGKNRTEGFDDYVRYGQQMGMQVLRGEAEMMADGKKAVSSSVIRHLLAENGNVALMPHYLTRNYSLTGHIVSGEHIGHQLGFPTANLKPDCSDKLIPAAGAYAVWAHVEGESQRRPAMMNIGTRPTFDGNHQTLEVNILDFDGNLYGKEVTVDFVERLRPEQRFESPEELSAQLHRDRKQVQQLLK